MDIIDKVFVLQILYFLGNEGSKTANPSKYIHYIYNQVILENATVRASVVSALTNFGALVESLKVHILYLYLVYKVILKIRNSDVLC